MMLTPMGWMTKDEFYGMKITTGFFSVHRLRIL